MRDYLEQGYVDHTDETFFAGIRKLPPAHSLVVDERGLALGRYWAARAARRRTATRPTRCASSSSTRCACACAATSPSAPASRAGSTRRRSSAPSTTCCAPRPRTRGPSATASARSPRSSRSAAFDERPYARGGRRADALAAALGHVRLARARRRAAVDRPRRRTSRSARRAIVAQWFVMRAAAGRGSEGDARRPGRRRDARRLPRLLRARSSPTCCAAGSCASSRAELARLPRRSTAPASRRRREALARPFLPERVRWAARGRARGGTRARAPATCPRTGRPGTRTASTRGYLRRQMQLILTRRGLPELLHYEDRNSMAHSLEARVPFLDYRLVELLFSLGASDLIRRGPDEGRAPARARRPAPAGRARPRGQARLRHARGGAGCGTGSASWPPDVFASRSFASAASSTPARRSAASQRHRRGREDRRLRALARTLRRALGARVPLGSAAVTTQEQVRDWWNRNPMSYDVDDPIPYDEGSQEFFREIDRRIFHPRYMRLTADASGKPFSLFVDFDSLRRQGRARRRDRQRDRDADARGGRREGHRGRPDRLGGRDDAAPARRVRPRGRRAPGRRRAAAVRRRELRPRVLVGRDPPLERHGPRARASSCA